MEYFRSFYVLFVSRFSSCLKDKGIAVCFSAKMLAGWLWLGSIASQFKIKINIFDPAVNHVVICLVEEFVQPININICK